MSAQHAAEHPQESFATAAERKAKRKSSYLCSEGPACEREIRSDHSLIRLLNRSGATYPSHTNAAAFLPVRLRTRRSQVRVLQGAPFQLDSTTSTVQLVRLSVWSSDIRSQIRVYVRSTDFLQTISSVDQLSRRRSLGPCKRLGPTPRFELGPTQDWLTRPEILW